jgi:hypothetical protein
VTIHQSFEDLAAMKGPKRLGWPFSGASVTGCGILEHLLPAIAQ